MRSCSFSLSCSVRDVVESDELRQVVSRVWSDLARGASIAAPQTAADPNTANGSGGSGDGPTVTPGDWAIGTVFSFWNARNMMVVLRANGYKERREL